MEEKKYAKEYADQNPNGIHHLHTQSLFYTVNNRWSEKKTQEKCTHHRKKMNKKMEPYNIPSTLCKKDLEIRVM